VLNHRGKGIHDKILAKILFSTVFGQSEENFCKNNSVLQQDFWPESYIMEDFIMESFSSVEFSA